MAYSGSTNSSSSTSSSVNGRYWGLASGLDVDSIVTAECTREQSKIDKAKQQQQQLEWQQEDYQDVITKLQSFQSAYLKIGGSNSMASSSMYGVYTAASDNSKLTVSSSEQSDGSSHSIDIIQSAKTAGITGGELGRIAGTLTDASTISAGSSFNIKVDGITKTITFDSDVSGSSAIMDALNKKLSDAFGTVVDSGTGNTETQKISAVLNGSTFEIKEAEGYNISIGLSSLSSDIGSALGFTEQSNRLNTASKLSSLFPSGLGGLGDNGYIYINNKKINFTNGSNETLADAISDINKSGAGVTAAYDSVTGKISITSQLGGSSGSITLGKAGSADSDDVSVAFFNSFLGKTGGVGDTVIAGSIAASGRDAIVSVDGTKYARSSNSFTINSVKYTINGTVDSTSQIKGINVSQNPDTSSLKTGIKDFINAYNSLIDTIGDYTDTKPSKDYKPLTDSQKKDMTETQIENWDKKARKGLLYNDSTLSGLMNDLRSMVGQSITSSDGTKFSLFSLGISSSDFSTDNGKLEIKPEDEAKFEKVLSQNSDKVAELFTKQSSLALNTAVKSATGKKQRFAEEGLVDRLDDIVDIYTGYVNGKSGSLLKFSGAINDSYSITSSTLYSQLQEISQNITDYTKQLNTKQDRLYTKFQKLESYMQQANSQSSMFSSFS